jgi:ribonucleoside-diphosphate reductase beta chain
MPLKREGIFFSFSEERCLRMLDGSSNEQPRTVNYVTKRDGSTENFNKDKIGTAVEKAMKSIGIRSKTLPNEVATEVTDILNKQHSHDVIVSVDTVHRTVENVIMDMGLHDLAREYILYRHNNMPSIFRKRTNLKPYEYPQLIEYLEAIRHSYWVHTEFNYSSDIQDMKVRMTPQEAEIVKKAMLAISQIEVQVKTFWAKIGDKMPKPEVQAVGVTFGESEVRHADAYSNLLEIMGLNSEFETLLEVPAIKKRIAYLEQSLQTPVDDRDYFHKIVLFSMFVENVSLFSQFLIMMAFNKHKNVLKGISNAISATQKEEDIHARFGFELVNIIKSENPDWFDSDTIKEVNRLCREAYKAESSIVDWIYGDTDLDFLPKETVKEFLKHRFNQSLETIGIKAIYETDKELVKSTDWFIEESLTTTNVDFFVKRATTYSKKTKSFSEDDLF